MLKALNFSDERLDISFHASQLLWFKDFQENSHYSFYHRTYDYKYGISFYFCNIGIYFKGKWIEYFNKLRDFVDFCRTNGIELEWK